MGLLEKAFFAAKNSPSPRVIGGKGLLVVAEQLRPQRNRIDIQTDTSSEITNLCIDRLSRLADDGSTVDTALSVLKAFFPITSAFVFILNDNTYVIANSVGSPALKVALTPHMQEYLVSAENSGLSTTFPASDLGFDYFPPNSNAQAYPLTTCVTNMNKSMLVLINEKDKIIAQESIRKVVTECAMKFLPNHTIKQRTPEITYPSATLNEITKSCEYIGGKAQILIIELSETAMRVVSDTISSALTLLVGNSAHFLEIGPSRFVIFLKEGIDRELYSHQLIKSAHAHLNLDPGQIRLIHSSDLLNPSSISEFISTLKKGL